LNLDNLIKSCINQNRKAQEELYYVYKKTLFVLCLKYCSNEKEAEDNLHDSFIEIFSNIKNYKNTGSFEGWIKRITINKAISKFKSSFDLKPLEAIIYPLVDTEIDLFEDEISLDVLLQFIQELPNQYRLVFNLYELDDYSHKEIAEMLSISEGTSKSNLHKAKIILKNKILEIKPKKSRNGI
jgi:RNA polymerase sigma factor (sigma-70 family)